MMAGMLYLDSYSLSINIVYYIVFTTYKDNDNFLSLQIPRIGDIQCAIFPKNGYCALGNIAASLQHEN
jgi:hypothetical protein